MFDYGYTKNLLKYGSILPPKYNLDLITAPVYLHYSDNDWMAAVKVIEILIINFNSLNLICNYF